MPALYLRFFSLSVLSACLYLPLILALDLLLISLGWTLAAAAGVLGAYMLLGVVLEVFVWAGPWV